MTLLTTGPTTIGQGLATDQLREVALALHEHTICSAQLVLDDGTIFSLPAEAIHGLHQLLGYLAAGHTVSIRPLGDLYGPAEAADFLGITDAAVNQLLAEGELAAQSVEAQPRIALADLVSYRAKLRAQRAEGVRLIQQLSEEEGAYGG